MSDRASSPHSPRTPGDATASHSARTPHPGAAPASRPDDASTPHPDDASTQHPVRTPGDATASHSARTPGDATASHSARTPGDATASHSARPPGDATASHSPRTPDDASTQHPARTPGDATASHSARTPDDATASHSARPPGDATASHSARPPDDATASHSGAAPASRSDDASTPHPDDTPTQHPARTPAPSAPRAAAPAWLTLFEALRSRVGGLGVAEHSGEIDDLGFDPELARLASVPLAWLRRGWLRLECAGQGALPAGRPLLFVASVSSRLPYEALLVAECVAALPGLQRPCFQVEDAWSAQPFVGVLLSRLGGVRACPENARRLLSSGRSLVVCCEAPSGQGGGARPRGFAQDAVLSVALECAVPVIPTAVVGAAEALAPAERLPTPLQVLVPPLPAKWAIQFGAALKPSLPGASASPAEAGARAAEQDAGKRRLARLVVEVDQALEQALAEAKRLRRSAFAL